VLRAAEEPEDESRKEAGVETRLGWKARQRRVGNSSREEVRGERETGHKVRPQPFAPIIAQPAKSGNRRRRGTCVHHSAASRLTGYGPLRAGSWRRLLGAVQTFGTDDRLHLACVLARALGAVITVDDAASPAAGPAIARATRWSSRPPRRKSSRGAGLPRVPGPLRFSLRRRSPPELPYP
jgi:hypothetical protein